MAQSQPPVQQEPTEITMYEDNLMGSLPRHEDTGIDDQSIPVADQSMEEFPIHTPLFMIKAARGTYDAVLYSRYSDAVNVLGEETFNSDLDYFNHQTLWAKDCLSAANACFIKRIDTGAKAATSTLIAVLDPVSRSPVWRDANGIPVVNPYVKLIFRGPQTGAADPTTFGYTSTDVSDGDIVKYLRAGHADSGKMWKVTSNGDACNPISFAEYTDNTESGININAYRIKLMVYTGPALADAKFNLDERDAYPIMQLRSDEGDLGNSIGYRLWPAVKGYSRPLTEDVFTQAGAMIYNIQLVKKLASGNNVVIESLLQDTVTQFAFKPKVKNYKTDEKLPVTNIVKNYSDDGKTTGMVPTYGPIQGVTLYNSSISALLEVLLDKNNAIRATLTTAMDSGLYVGPSISANGYATLVHGEDLTNKWLIDPISCKDISGANHYGFFTQTTGPVITTGSGNSTVTATVVNLSSTKTVFLTDGTDGDLTDVTTSSSDPAELSVYETNVIELMNQVEDEKIPLIDSARYPFTHIYDSGFSNQVKKALMGWVDIRPSVFVTISVLRDGEGVLSASAELSRGLVLANEAKLYMESSEFGTPSCRIGICMQSGMMANESYDKRVSLSHTLLIKRARFMGAGDGTLKKEFAYDVYPRNIVDDLTDISLTYLNATNKVKAWSNGLIYAQSFNKNQVFLPAFHTVYEYEDSVLTGEIFVQICNNVKDQAEKIWRMFTGRSDLDNDQFTDKTTKAMQKLIGKRYGKRVIVESLAYITKADDRRGSFWKMRNIVYGNVAKTVQQSTVVAKRMP